MEYVWVYDIYMEKTITLISCIPYLTIYMAVTLHQVECSSNVQVVKERLSTSKPWSIRKCGLLYLEGKDTAYF